MKSLTYKGLLKYLFCALLFYFANNVVHQVPFAIALVTAFLNYNLSPLAITVIFCLVNFLSFTPLQCLALLISSVFLFIVFTIYKSKNALVKGELFIYVAISLIPYCLFDFVGNIYTKLAYSAIIYAFAVIFNLFVKVIFINQFKIKNDRYENIAFAISCIFLSFGIITVTSFDFYKFIALTTALLFCSFYKNTKALLPSFVLSLSLSIYSSSFEPIAVFEIICVSSLIFINISHFLSGISVILLQTAIYYFKGDLIAFSFIDYFYTFAPTLIFLFLPQKLINNFKQKLTRFGEPLLTREIINIERNNLSLKLNNLAQVFTELENTLQGMDQLVLTKERLIEKIADEVLFNVCTECSYYEQCIQKNKPEKEHIIKLINIGCLKGKVTLIDLSRDFSEYCYSATNMLAQINKLLETYQEKQNEISNICDYKSNLITQSHAVSEVLKQFAFDFSHKIEFQHQKEKLVFENLTKVGVIPKQLLFVENKYHLIFDKQKIIYSAVAKVLSSALDEDLSLISKNDIGDNVITTFAKAPKLDACFGIATKTKEGGIYNGDSHSLTKIDNGKFIVSLCDGMGSGEKAQINSSLAISLFENFYKVGLNSKNALKLANKLLSVCSSENFSTLDCAIFDLYKKQLNIIKIGACYGFLICENEVRILENTSLPLGILDEISPNYYSMAINSGDMLVMLSDGVADAFFSSTDTVDFLNANKNKNPQTLANKLMSYAVEKYGGIAKDDMTVIVTKIY